MLQLQPMQSGVPVDRQVAQTDDGLTLAIKRYPNPGAQPVVLVHGLAQNHTAFDLPLRGHNLARYLWQRGFDVWLPNLRSHGRDEYASQAGPSWDWCVDDYGLRDVPAIVDRVLEVTGKAPFYIGHSMGGMVLYMHLQGAYFDDDGCVRTSDALCAERNQQLAGAITLGSPVSLKWSRGGVTSIRRWTRLIDARTYLRMLSGQGWVRQLLMSLRFAPTRELAASLLDQELGQTSIDLRKLLYWPLGKATKFLSHNQIWHDGNMTPVLLDLAVRKTTDHCCSMVLVQFLDWIYNGTFREFARPDHDRPLHDYNAGLSRLSLPLLMVAGELDQFLDMDVLHREGYVRVGSTDKSLVVLPETGHADILYGTRMPTALFPMLLAWMRRRCHAPLVPGGPGD